MTAERLLYRALPLALLLLALGLLRASDLIADPGGTRGTAVALGFLLVASFVAGKVAVRFGLPRITGYLLAGLLLGPAVSHLLTAEMLAGRKVVGGIAVALIALTAGGELKLPWLKRSLRSVSAIAVVELMAVLLGLWAAIQGLQHAVGIFPPNLLPEGGDAMGLVALVLAAIAVANSPAVAIAVINDSRADGPVARTVLGVTILKDLLVVVLFAVVMSFARHQLGEGAGESLAVVLSRELLGSVALGLVAGWIVVWYLRHVGRELPVFVLVVCFALYQLSSILHLELILAAVAAGFYVENFSDGLGHRLVEALERVSLPVYALFFAGAGTKVDLGVLATLWLPAVLLVLTRALTIFVGTWLGARMSGAGPTVRRWAWTGFVSQAGVSLALAAIVARTFPGWGEQLEILLIALVAIHELVGPPLFLFALRRSGEVDKRE
ncbi:MAG: cation:proton antiporter [Myxococcota bacterium]